MLKGHHIYTFQNKITKELVKIFINPNTVLLNGKVNHTLMEQAKWRKLRDAGVKNTTQYVEYSYESTITDE